MADTKQYCTFHIGRQYFGLDVLKVQEVVRHQPLTPVPLAPPTVRGLINLRGQIVTAIDAHRRLELPREGAPSEAVNVVVQGDDGAYSLLVDEIGDVLEVPLDQFEPPPVTLPLKRLDLIQGVYKLSDRLLIILDPQRIVEPPELPGLAVPGASQPGASQPGTSQPGVCQPGTSVTPAGRS